MIYTCELCGSDFLTEADPYIVRPTRTGVKLYCVCQIRGFEEMKGAEKLKEENKKLVEALTKIAGRCSIAEDNKDKIHGPEAGVIFAAASAWRMELAKQVLKEIGEE